MSKPNSGQTSRRWRHKARGSEYTEIGRANLQASTRRPAEGETLVIYRSADGTLWARLVEESSRTADSRRSPMPSDPSGKPRPRTMEFGDIVPEGYYGPPQCGVCESMMGKGEMPWRSPALLGADVVLCSHCFMGWYDAGITDTDALREYGLARRERANANALLSLANPALHMGALNFHGISILCGPIPTARAG